MGSTPEIKSSFDKPGVLLPRARVFFGGEIWCRH
jgi:hypothetical protein